MTELQNDRITERQNDRMTDRTKTICPPIFDLGGIKIIMYNFEIILDQLSRPLLLCNSISVKVIPAIRI